MKKERLNKITKGDCLELLKDLPDKSIDLVITDPPYGVSFKKKGQTYLPGDGINLMPVVLPELYRVLKDDGAIFVFSSTPRLHDFLITFQTYFKLHNIIIWDKIQPTYPFSKAHFLLQYEPIMYGSKGLFHLAPKKAIGDVIQARNPRGKIRTHPTQKPVDLIEKIIGATPETSRVILDPFAGTGATLVAAKNKGRDYIGFELSEKYCEIAEHRLESPEQQLFISPVAIV